MTRPWGNGAPQGPWLRPAPATQRHCCPPERCLSLGGTAPATVSPARRCTTRLREPGAPRALWARPAPAIRRRCCPLARCWSPEAVTRCAAPSARRCTTRSPGCGALRELRSRPALAPRRRCCPLARCWSLGERLTLRSRQRGGVRSSHGGLEPHGRSGHGSLGPHGDAVALWPGADDRGRRVELPPLQHRAVRRHGKFPGMAPGHHFTRRATAGCGIQHHGEPLARSLGGKQRKYPEFRHEPSRGQPPGARRRKADPRRFTGLVL